MFSNSLLFILSSSYHLFEIYHWWITSQHDHHILLLTHGLLYRLFPDLSGLLSDLLLDSSKELLPDSSNEPAKEPRVGSHWESLSQSLNPGSPLSDLNDAGSAFSLPKPPLCLLGLPSWAPSLRLPSWAPSLLGLPSWAPSLLGLPSWAPSLRIFTIISPISSRAPCIQEIDFYDKRMFFTSSDNPKLGIRLNPEVPKLGLSSWQKES